MNGLRSIGLLVLASTLGGVTYAQRTPPARPAPAKRPSAATFPQLGDEVPESLLRRAAAKACDVGEGRTDPCATLTSGKDRISVAWDATTHRVTYLYSTTLGTDDDIRAGDVLGIEPDSPITPFPAPGAPHRFVTSDWCDTDAHLSGSALWCAAMVPVRPKAGKVLGFVQSLYLYLPLWDASPLHKTSEASRKARR